ncbi:GNAT family N-acetyltransferase [Limosilactobacillus reuteri]|jgi:RimJ/RimL family protein N-acetyltransferase|uniref:GNAT family N-acetyltransferase n=1 Tax=Limosilactobacillus reuteri TaxID=1598 RepID=UPI00109397FA|nr:GNAT family N-acetyltransferase [Limosilactobacillus reuteri]TGY48505.1 GNAT family N-acetyltransferase [Limosilactobacillus reuteri]
MKIRKATMADLEVVVDILRDGRNQLAERGVDQWQGDYPNVTHVKEDIENGYAYLVKADDGQTVGTLAIVEAPDYFYDKLNGKWLINTENYVVIHRVAIHSRHAGKGYASKLFLSLIEYLETERPEIKSIRLSTNENNMAMQRIATKSGFKKVGTLHGAFRPSELSYVYELLTKVRVA